MRRYILYIGILLSMVLTSCSIVERPDSDEEGYGKEVAVKGTIMARATGTPEDAINDNELINDWWVLFVDNSNKIVKYLDRKTATGNTNPVVRESFFIEIPAGTYTTYSFANVTREEVQEIVGSLQEGQQLPNLDAASYTISNKIPNGRDVLNNSTAVPMSGKQVVTFSEKGNNGIELEVIRLVAKIEFNFTNESTSDISLISLTMPVPQDKQIPLLPNYDYLENGIPVAEDESSEGPNLIADSQLNVADARDLAYNIINYNTPENGSTTLIKNGGKTENLDWYRVRWSSNENIKAEETINASVNIKSDRDVEKIRLTLVKAEDNGTTTDIARMKTVSLKANVATTINLSYTTKENERFALQIEPGNADPGTTLVLKNQKLCVAKHSTYSPFDRLERSYNNQTISKNNGTFNDYFYLQESVANFNPTHRYFLNIKVGREGKAYEDVMYALTSELSYIYRNDHIIIPLVFTDYLVDFDVKFYPPIGGYPAVIENYDETKKQLYCEFATQGNFTIRPKVVNTANSYQLLYTNGDPHFDYQVVGYGGQTNIFSILPHIEEGTGELIGCLGTSEGTAFVDIEITVHKEGSAADQIYDRRVYITRKNR